MHKAPLSSTTLITSLVSGAEWLHKGFPCICFSFSPPAIGVSLCGSSVPSFLICWRNVGARWPLQGWLLQKTMSAHATGARGSPESMLGTSRVFLQPLSCGWRSGPCSCKYKAKASSAFAAHVELLYSPTRDWMGLESQVMAAYRSVHKSLLLPFESSNKFKSSFNFNNKIQFQHINHYQPLQEKHVAFQQLSLTCILDSLPARSA